MSTNKTISQKVTRQQTLGSEAPQPLCLLYPSQLKRKKKKYFVIYHNIYFVSAALL